MKVHLWNSFLTMLAASAVLLAARPADSQQEDIDISVLLQRLEAQEARVQELESRLGSLSRTPPLSLTPATEVVHSNDMLRRIEALETSGSACTDEHQSQEVHQGWEHKWGGRIMFDYAMYANQNGGSFAKVGDAENYAEFRRVRFFASGKGYGVYDYKLQVDFEPEQAFRVDANNAPRTILTDGVAIRDAYMGIHDLPFLGYVRLGNFKEAFSLEEMGSSRFTTFLERSLPNIFTPMRHVGIQAHNQTYNEQFCWQYGAFFDSIDQVAKERVSDNQGIDLVARFVWTPQYAAEGRYLTHIGVGAIYTDDRDNLVAYAARPETHESSIFLNTGPMAASDYLRFNLEAAKSSGPLSLQGELFYVRVDDVGADFYGAYAYVSYFLTGENRSYKRSSASYGRVTPFTNFWMVRTCDGPCMGWGAWEVAARWSYLDLSDPAATGPFAGKQNDATLGLNWYLNPHMRMMFNYIHSWTDYSNGDPSAENDILSIRWQVDF